MFLPRNRLLPNRAIWQRPVLPNRQALPSTHLKLAIAIFSLMGNPSRYDAVRFTQRAFPKNIGGIGYRWPKQWD
jgi:hypothetical protein